MSILLIFWAGMLYNLIRTSKGGTEFENFGFIA